MGFTKYYGTAQAEVICAFHQVTLIEIVWTHTDMNKVPNHFALDVNIIGHTRWNHKTGLRAESLLL